MDNCPICGSNRMVEGPAYDRGAAQCMDCGSQFNREVRTEPKEEEISIAVSEENPFPVGGFSSQEEAMAHLAKLKEASARLGKTKVTVGDKVNKPKRKLHPTSDYPTDLVMAELHYYQRKGESWNEVLSTAKGERGVRNENVLIFFHNHHPDQSCTNSCREILTDG